MKYLFLSAILLLNIVSSSAQNWPKIYGQVGPWYYGYTAIETNDSGILITTGAEGAPYNSLIIKTNL